MLLLRHEEELILVDGACRSLTLELEDHYAIVMASGEEIDLRMCCYDPESVVLALEALHACSFVEIPDTYRLVFADRQYQILVWVEQTCASVLKVTSASVHFPSFRL